MDSKVNPPDIKTTRLRVVIGATIIGCHDQAITLDPDCKKLPLRFTESPYTGADKPVYEANLMVEFQHGTVEEMVQDFKNKLEKAFYYYTYQDKEGKAAEGLLQARAEERWAEIEVLQRVLDGAGVPNDGNAGVKYLGFTDSRVCEERKAREKLQLLREANQEDTA